MKSETKIICTIGPASSNEKTLLPLARAGMNVVRLNMSHGDYNTHQKVIELIRRINKKNDLDLKILIDLEGYRIRIGILEKPLNVVENKNIILSSSKCKSTHKCLAFDYNGNMNMIPVGSELFIDDGRLRFKIIEIRENSVLIKSYQDGIVSSRKGVNIPDLKIPDSTLSKKDEQDIQFGLKNNVDYIAQSFVSNAHSIILVTEALKKLNKNCGVIAKIENSEGVKNIDSIISACAGIMIARGDLGISLPVYKVPIIQKYIISRCIRMKKQVIIATQMLESMLDSLYPTRADVSDVANGIFDGADFLMLSAETAVGKYPVQTVQMMNKIIEFTENSVNIQPDL